MFLFALMLAASDYPLFDLEQTTKQCEILRSQDMWAKVYKDNASCIADQQADYRRFTIITNAKDDGLAPSFHRCARRWTKDGLTDWNMTIYCVIGNVDGKRDVELLRADAPRDTLASIDTCIADKDDDATAWDDVADCARSQLAGRRDFFLFRNAAPDKATRDFIDTCRASAVDDKSIDWEDAINCVAAGRLPDKNQDEGEDSGAIVVT